jgi:hypothetical protein
MGRPLATLTPDDDETLCSRASEPVARPDRASRHTVQGHEVGRDREAGSRLVWVFVIHPESIFSGNSGDDLYTLLPPQPPTTYTQNPFVSTIARLWRSP